MLLNNNDIVRTNRLVLYPLNYNQLQKYIQNNNSLETELNVNQSKRIISTELNDALNNCILPNVANNPANYMFHTLWTIICIEENTIIGDICFTGEPNESGEVGIGYGTYHTYFNKGYMTEAVSGLISWASLKPTINFIVAETEKENIASQKVLEKNHFVKTTETGNLLKYRYNLRPEN